MQQEDIFHPHLIYIVGSDLDQITRVGVYVREFGFQVASYSTLAEFRDACSEMLPDAVIADLPASDFMLLQELSDSNDWPWCVISVDDGIDIRLQAIRAGAKTFFSRTTPLSQVVEELEMVTSFPKSSPFRVLIVDDEPIMAMINKTVLESSNFVTKVISSEVDLLASLESFKPELVLMDLYLRNCLGSELATIIRQSTQKPTVPLVYISSEENPEIQLSAIRSGGDDFLVKPIYPVDLFSSVIPLVKRYRTMNQLLEQDRLTGALTFTSLIQQLEQILSRAEQHTTPVSFALIDLDHLQDFNCTFGIASGDRMIKDLNMLLKKTLPNTTVVGRFGSNCFAAVFPNIEKSEAQHLVDQVCTRLTHFHHKTGNKEVQLTATFGISSYPEKADRRTLVDAAMECLNLAKQRKRQIE